MKNILVIQTGKLGDMVCTTPVFRAIKGAYPAATLVVAGSALNEQVLRGNPHIDHYWDFRTMTTESVHAAFFDAAIVLNPNPEILRILQRSDVPKIVVPKVIGGYSPYMTKRFRFWSLFATRVPHRMGHYAPQEYLNMLKPLGIESSDTRKELYVDTQAQAVADQLLAPYAQKLKVAIAPGAGNKIKEWPPERFNEVAKYLVAQKGALVVIIGGSADAPLAQIVATGLPEGNVLDTVGKLSIEELKAVIQKMDLFISADTGPIYIAEAFDVSTIDIVGPVDEREQPPIAPPRHVVVVPQRTKPELYVMNARTYDAVEARRQSTSISSRVVMEAVGRSIATYSSRDKFEIL